MRTRILHHIRLIAWFVLLGALGAASGGTQVLAQSSCPGLLPESGAGVPESSCAYTHVPFATFTYTGDLRATWPPAYEVLEAYILADWEVVGSYTPGTTVNLPIDTSKARYDIVARFRTVATGEEFKGITPIWCVTAASIPAPLEGCFGEVIAAGCKITESTICPDGTVVSVTCEGDSGTCSSSADSGGVSCQSSTTSSGTSSDGTKTTETVVKKKSQSCPSS